jgi:DNA-binding CsgD family transcriptional regulator
MARRAVALCTANVLALDQAIGELRHAGDLLGAATAMVERARFAQGGAEAGAQERLAAALDLADRVGAAGVSSMARSELKRIGARPRRNRVSGVAALTPAELRTATLAATGATNREVAQAMVVSLKTVETQLAAAYRKLGCGGRSGLAAALIS